MKYAQIPYVEKPVSGILFGTAMPPFLTGGEDDALLDAVLELGITAFDTGKNYIDIYLLCRDDPDVDVAVPVEVMNALHAEGKIGAFGGSNWTHQRIEEANEYAYRRGLIHVTVSSPNFGLADQVQMGLSEGEILYLNLRK